MPYRHTVASIGEGSGGGNGQIRMAQGYYSISGAPIAWVGNKEAGVVRGFRGLPCPTSTR